MDTQFRKGYPNKADLDFAQLNYYTMRAENQAAAKQTFDFQAMAPRDNAPQGGDKAAKADLDFA